MRQNKHTMYNVESSPLNKDSGFVPSSIQTISASANFQHISFPCETILKDERTLLTDNNGSFESYKNGRKNGNVEYKIDSEDSSNITSLPSCLNILQVVECKIEKDDNVWQSRHDHMHKEGREYNCGIESRSRSVRFLDENALRSEKIQVQTCQVLHTQMGMSQKWKQKRPLNLSSQYCRNETMVPIHNINMMMKKKLEDRSLTTWNMQLINLVFNCLVSPDLFTAYAG